MELPKATVYRILSTLEGRGYLDRSADGSYRLAKKLFDLQRTVPLEQTLHRVSQPVMERLAASCKETVNLGIVDAGEVVVINTVESPQAVRMSSKIGNRRHLHSTAIGKVMLAGMPDKEVQRLLRLKGMPKLTEETLTSKAAVLEEILRVRQQGWALDNQENEIEGRCVGAPIARSGGAGDRGFEYFGSGIPDGSGTGTLAGSGVEGGLRGDLTRGNGLSGDGLVKSERCSDWTGRRPILRRDKFVPRCRGGSADWKLVTGICGPKSGTHLSRLPLLVSERENLP